MSACEPPLEQVTRLDRICLDDDIDMSLTTSDGMLYVILHAPIRASRTDIERCQSKVLGAFAMVEKVSAREVQGVVWHKRTSALLNRFVAKRKIADPDYPQQFALAVRELSGEDESHWLFR
jgi:hypothetical protein